MALILKGSQVAAAMSEELSRRAASLAAEDVRPTLAILRVGERADDIAYENAAVKRCLAVGVDVIQHHLPQNAPREKLLTEIDAAGKDSGIHGLLLLRPLADTDAEDAARAALSPEKDIDGMTAASLCGVFTGSSTAFPPCTAEACVTLLDHYGIPLAGRRVTVIGRSLVVGRPLSMLLLARDATVTVCHSKTADLAEACRSADIVVSAAGRARLLDRSFFRAGQVVVDVGMSTDADGSLCGDVCFDEVEPIVHAITPVPGGIGAMTTAVLARHVIIAAEIAKSRKYEGTFR
ncbi:MAG: bifunctional 5,10-methylenetetrahydrofolate dehydrogenase/5,10-methenyltetrahydrofolate cyclohydrolase [Oscillospiraceae bacterium]|nr:bifunctional 5,10-methylenetetrahydrofolate dehydrogenase/5,10-methenyltetrahydrofolate cyclohydrolase [Oscillospiraceae bacterium]